MVTGRPWVADNGDGTYRNPVLNADFSDPDVIRVGTDFYLTASSFSKVPGLPILHSRDLVNWEIIGHALLRGPAEPRPGRGVWAPSIRYRDGMFWIFYGDPDEGIYVTTAENAAGPWREPHLLKKGRGLIDPCPFWDDDGRAYLVHGWARSRAGVNNRLTLHRMTGDAAGLLDDGEVVVDGELIPGCHTLEGPKVYRHAGWYWIFAPAGGVATGWQSAFRSRRITGPYEHRVVLEQGDTGVNGPHQGGWVTLAPGTADAGHPAADGGGPVTDWFLHFQDRGPYGRVVHLQPMRWDEDGWPVIGDRGRPVAGYRKPVAGGRVTAPQTDDDFSGPGLGLQWSWNADPDPAGWALDGGRLRLECRPGPEDPRLRGDVLTQRFPAETFTASTTLRLTGERAGLAVLGGTYAWVGLENTPGGPRLVCRADGADLAPPIPVPEAAARLSVTVGPGALCRFGTDRGEIGPAFRATPGAWVGAVLALFADGTTDHAEFGGFTVTAESGDMTQRGREQ
ncbi:beta-xylosidase [Streptosporangium becharense]|uniref:Beta-xylosidase n=1 Tax=Streptosporangium becharense TaxID=1816182 RepID=A0A7W9IEI6_9ACTN|nr:glycoside hydrolase 43 family protein [Streptosporangium becharense]MBB2909805.1 beta-xylosidase [Streptosporangium becharense]MBB5819240.1 beta-xylosidase [Streptosporangium becharense]